MNQIVSFISVIFFTCCDITVSTVLYCHGNQCYQQFSVSVSEYSFDVSVFDIWLTCIIRCAISFGLIIALLCNPSDTVTRAKLLISIPVIVSGLLIMFTLIKLLAISEIEIKLSDSWFWGIFSSTIAFSIFMIINWWLITKIVLPQNLRLLVNSDDTGETEPLLQNSVKNSDGNSKKASTEKVKKTKGSILRLLSLSRPDWPFIITGFLFLAASATGEIFIPYFTGRVVDGIVIDKSREEFTSAIIYMALISAGSSVAAGIRGGCFIIVIKRLNIRIRNQLFSSILRQEIGFFDKTTTGDITSRLTSDTATMSDTLGLNVNIFLRSTIKAVGVVIFMFNLSWRMSVVTLIGLPCIMAVSKVYGSKFKKLSTKVQDSLADANKVAEEACSTMKTVRSFANEVGETARYAASLDKTYQLNKKQAVLYAGFVWVTQLFQLAVTVSVLYYGGDLVLTGMLTGGTLISFILYQIQLGDCLNILGNVYTGLMQAAGASEKVFEYIDREPEIKNDGTLAPKGLKGQIEFKNVSFHYPSRPDTPVLKNISFSVSPGEVVALVGPSGAGKTSCIALLEHFYTPVSGQVLLDSMPVQEYEHHYLHRQISMVGQEPVLYARSLSENIAYGLLESEWSQDDVQEAAKLANAHMFVCEMKDKYKTQTGEKGAQLSGGQKQRVAIARALLRKPKVLLLDEATSALDSESEFTVQQALYQNLSGHTVIIIAHRLSTVEKADRIIVIDKGEIIEQGTHQQLLRRKGLYSGLVKRQLLDSDSAWLGARNSSKELRDLTSSCPCRHRRCSGRSSGRNWSGGSQLSEDDIDAPPRATFIVGSL